MASERWKLRRATGDWAGAGEWKGLRTESGDRTASVGCPKCGGLASLRDHNIDAGGIVTPSLVCPYEGCDFHEWVRLQGWSAPKEPVDGEGDDG